MKKILFSLITILLTIVIAPVVKAEEKVPVYMFSKDGCSACIAAQEYFDELITDYPDLFDLIELEVFDANWEVTSDDLKELLVKTYDKFGEDSSKAATPTIVIGEYHTIGLPQDTSVIYDEIVKVRDSEEKVDTVKEIADDLGIDIEEVRKTSAISSEAENEGSKYDTIIIIGIFVVLIGGFAGLIIVGKK